MSGTQGARPVRVTPEEFGRSLRRLGLRADDLLIVHSSLRSFGHFEGGAAAVVDCLMEVVREGTIVTPTYTRRSLERNPARDLEEYDASREPSIDGAITEEFRLRPDVIRQPNNPWHPMAVWGRLQKRLIEARPYSTYDSFIAFGGKTLLVGVGHETHSFVHSILDEAENEGLLRKGAKVKSILFPRLEPWLVREGAQRETICGASRLRLIELVKARDAVKLALRESPDLLDPPPREEELSRRINTFERPLRERGP